MEHVKGSGCLHSERPRRKDATKTYDGTPLTCSEYTIVEGALLNGHTIVNYEITGSQTEIGRSDHIISKIQIQDEFGNDVTANYSIVLLPGRLTVTKR